MDNTLAVTESEAKQVPDFKRCTCVSALPGRSCPACGSSHWIRKCKSCNGSGMIFKQRRYSSGGQSPAQEKCADCMNRGWLPATREQATKMESEYESHQKAESSK